MTLTQITEKGIKDGEIIDADINASAAIAKSKLASLDIVNGDINASAAIAGSKISPNFGSQDIVTTSSLSISVGSSGTNASAGFNELTIEGGNEDIGMCFISPAANERTHTIAFGDSNNNNAGKIEYNHSTDDLTLTASDNIILTGDNVGIGLTNPSEKLHLYQDATDNVLALFEQNTVNQGNLLSFKQTTTGSVTRTAYIGHGGDATGNLMLQNSGGLILQTNGNNTALTIDTSQNVGIGTSPAFVLDVKGATADTLRLNNSNETAHGSHDCKLVAGGSNYNNFDFQASTYKFQTYNGSSLGERFRIRSTGGVTFNGDTADANALDDYEEGTWTPVLAKAGASGNTDSQVGGRAGYYVKSGSMLWVSFYWYSSNLSFGTGSNAWYIDGLPFNLLTQINSAYQFIPGGYLYQNAHTGVSHQAGYRWQSNSTNGAASITMYGQGNTTNASGGAWEFSGCGVLRTA